MIQLFLIYSDIAILALRAVLGFIFIGESIPKIKTPGLFTTHMKEAGVRFPIFTFLGIAGIELFGGACLLLGVFTQLMAILLMVSSMMMCLVSYKMGVGQNKKMCILSLASLAVLATVGGGVWSIDEWFGILIY